MNCSQSTETKPSNSTPSNSDPKGTCNAEHNWQHCTCDVDPSIGAIGLGSCYVACEAVAVATLIADGFTDIFFTVFGGAPWTVGKGEWTCTASWNGAVWYMDAPSTPDGTGCLVRDQINNNTYGVLVGGTPCGAW